MRREPRPREQLFAEDLAPESVDLVALGEKPVAADVEPIALVLIGPADAADHARVGFENDARLAVLADSSYAAVSPAGPPPAMTVSCAATTATVSGSSTRVQRWGISPGRNVSDSWPLRAHDRLLILRGRRPRLWPRRGDVPSAIY